MPSALMYVAHYAGMGHNAGGEMSAHAVMVAMKEAGWDCAVLLSEEKEIKPYYLDGIPVIVPQDRDSARALPLNLFGQYDVILTQLHASMRAGLLGRRKMGKPVVHLVHNDHTFTRNMVIDNTDVPIYNTHWIQEKWGLQDWKPGIVLHPVVDPEKYAVESNREYITLINLSEGSDAFYDKGSSTFYELARRNPDLQFLGVKGAYGTQDIRQMDNVTIVDHTDDIAEVYQKTRVLLVPSKYESYGRVAVEAACSGIPSICTPTDGLKEAMGANGVYADYQDYDAWDESLQLILGNYSAHSFVAYDRAQTLWQQTQEEIRDLVWMMEVLVEGGVEGWRSAH